MIFVYYILAALLIYLSYRSYRGGSYYLNYFKAELAKATPDFTPFASVIAPCKGLDEGLRENLDSLVSQDYPEFEIVFVVDRADDPSVPVIQDILTKTSNTRLVIAPVATDSSQKVENLREAVLHISKRCEVLAFVDSDVRPKNNWLRYLVAPLADDAVGAATGYRWYVSNKPSFASELRSAWNASVASVLGANRNSNFCWGGSTAIRRSLFEGLSIRDGWRGTLSDDFTMTRILRRADFDIVFVPQALTRSIGDCSMYGLLEFTTRQMKITRVYSTNLWRLSFYASGLYITVMTASLATLMSVPPASFPFWYAALTLLLVSAFNIGKARLRLRAVKMVVEGSNIDRQLLPQAAFSLVTPVLFFFNCSAGLFSRRLTWRGKRYELVSPTETRVIG